MRRRGSSTVLSCLQRMARPSRCGRFYLGTPSPGYQEIIRPVWNHDHPQLVYAARAHLVSIRKMMKDAQFGHPFCRPHYRLPRCKGVRLDRARRGRSWTVSRDVACWFAGRFMTKTKLPLVLTATVEPSQILLYDDERSEQEVGFVRSIRGRADPQFRHTWCRATCGTSSGARPEILRAGRKNTTGQRRALNESDLASRSSSHLLRYRKAELARAQLFSAVHGDCTCLADFEHGPMVNDIGRSTNQTKLPATP